MIVPSFASTRTTLLPLSASTFAAFGQHKRDRLHIDVCHDDGGTGLVERSAAIERFEEILIHVEALSQQLTGALRSRDVSASPSPHILLGISSTNRPNIGRRDRVFD